jgi:ribosomal protein S18 acetylase RimI-like enzyme
VHDTPIRVIPVPRSSGGRSGEASASPGLGPYRVNLMELRLEPFQEAHAATVLGWVESVEEAERWAAVGSRVLEPALFREWHEDPEVVSFVCLDGATPVGYGEVWEDRQADEAELARILVDPALRGRGIGRRLTVLLGERARAAGFEEVWLRVVLDNEPALAAYRAAGFERASPEEEASFNAGQPCDYVWMQLAGAREPGAPR